MAQPKVLITGGSGYLGQFLLFGLHSQYQLAYTYGSRELQVLPQGGHAVVACKVDLATGEGLAQAFAEHGPFAAVVNCAAVSQPGVCEKDPDLARAVNVPAHLLRCLQQQKQDAGVEALLVHISTDQVYSGERANWREDDACEPVNVYGRSKLEAEQAVQTQWPLHAILRSSIIYGPQPPNPVPRTLFLQFVDSALAEGKPTAFFSDEFRCPVYVQDIVEVVRRLLQQPARKHLVYNMGGPERLSRVDMAHKVAACRGRDTAAIVVAPSASVARGVASPPDISMLVDRLVEDLGLQTTPFSDGVAATFAN